MGREFGIPAPTHHPRDSRNGVWDLSPLSQPPWDYRDGVWDPSLLFHPPWDYRDGGWDQSPLSHSPVPPSRTFSGLSSRVTCRDTRPEKATSGKARPST